MRAAGLRLVTAESCTGGMVCAALTAVPGSSDVVEGGIVTYSNAMKRSHLGVSETSLATHGAVSEAVAEEMAEGARARSGADVAVSITGIAGPGGSEHKPEGRVCFAIAGPAGTHSGTQEFGAIGRAEVRQASVAHALSLLLDAAQKVAPDR
ncbi:CinA family protein [Mesobaculum littorinae]|uniref:CinA family protein n=2 Tax=Mesobaculum littorinae TaxID=2486419 RepID=A0A438AN34_9RHOB|nr:CinA family protein [Mesobaculum littorinae]